MCIQWCVYACVCVCVAVCVTVCVLQHKQEEADEVKRKFAQESRSDHIALLKAYEVHCH